jgi:ribonuclease G
MPNSSHIGVSTRIDDEPERERLRQLVELVVAEQGIPGGFIVRTVAEGADENAILADIPFLQKLWADLEAKLPNLGVPGELHRDMPLYLRALRDMARAPIDRIRVDSRLTWQQMQDFSAKYAPQLVELIELYSGDRPLLELYGVEEELRRALEPRVPLKSNGYLIFEQTEAMTTVDVNTGAFVGHRNLEETIFKTNLEAASAIARQLRLRNLGGIIILDFIDLKDPEHQRQVLRTLEKALEKDNAKTRITGVSELGFVEMGGKSVQNRPGPLPRGAVPLREF